MNTTKLTDISNMDNSSAPHTVPTEGPYPHEKYVPLLKLGAGTKGRVYLSLSVQDYQDALSHKTTNSYDRLLPKLKAVKVFDDESVAQKEVEVLQRVAQHLDKHGHPKGAYSLLLDHGVSWLVTEAIFPSITLEDCRKIKPTATFLVSYFQQIVDAIKFLHETCEPAMPHGDLFEGNILVSLPGRGAVERPPITFIDFSNTEGLKPVFAFNPRVMELRSMGQMFLAFFDVCKELDAQLEFLASLRLPDVASLQELSDKLQTILDLVLSGKPEAVSEQQTITGYTEDEEAYELRLVRLLRDKEDALLEVFWKTGLLQRPPWA